MTAKQGQGQPGRQPAPTPLAVAAVVSAGLMWLVLLGGVGLAVLGHPASCMDPGMTILAAGMAAGVTGGLGILLGIAAFVEVRTGQRPAGGTCLAWWGIGLAMPGLLIVLMVLGPAVLG